MPAAARVTSVWKNQKLFVALFLSAVSIWFFIDGKWTWPRSNERWLAYDQFNKENRLKEWPPYAQSHGWKLEPPHKYYDRDAILAQFAIGTLAALLGAVTLLYWLTQKNRVVKTDGEAVFAPSGRRVPFTSITGLGLKKWESKGYAKVRYEIDGRKGEFTLDDYKFDRDPIHEILQEIEGHLKGRSNQ
ncbi:MAG: hypothetical protein QOE70_3760 [Chthoniobacter sp.]|jgi:hypothetical protein|nr:hypothetical protein [Chthoniobacter sp.]